MDFFKAPIYTDSMLEALSESEVQFPFTDKDAVYVGRDHQYELTSKYFEERGVNLIEKVDGNAPDKVPNFLRDLRLKFYTHIYTHNKSTRMQLNYMIAKRGLRGFSPYEYRQAFLEAMYIEGCYLLANGDISSVSGVDLDTMQNMSGDVMREQDRDFHKDALELLKTLGLNYYGRYNFIPTGMGKEW